MCTNLFKNILIGTHSSMYVAVAAPLYPQEEFYFTTVLVKKKLFPKGQNWNPEHIWYAKLVENST